MVTLRKLSRSSRMRSKGHYLRGRTQRCLIDKARRVRHWPATSYLTVQSCCLQHSAFCSLEVGVESRDKQSEEWGMKQTLSPQKNPNNAAHLGESWSKYKLDLGSSLRAGLQFRVFQTLEMKRGSDAGSGEEIEPEKEPRVVLSLVQNHTVVRYRLWLLQEHVSRVGRVEQRQSKHLEAAVSLWHP